MTAILSLYALVGFAALFLIFVSRSHRLMNAISIMHPAVYLLIGAYSWMYTKSPEYPSGGYFFMDSLSIYEIVIAATLFFFSAIYSRGYIEGSIKMGELNPRNLKLYYVVFNLLLITIAYSFLSNNLALFWIFAELTTLFSAVLVVTLNAKKNLGAALKYVFIASTSMLFSFIGLIFIFAMTQHALGSGTLDWNVLVQNAGKLSPTVLAASFAFLFIGFAAKSGVVPFHAWLPTAHSKAPAPISVILSGSVTSVGIYGILRAYAIVSATPALPKVSMLLLVFGLLSMVVAAFSMLQQVNLKKLIGFSTIEHMGLVLVGLGIGTPLAIFWVLFHVLAHSLTKALLFFSAGIMHHQYESVRMEHIKDALKLQPLASWGLIAGSVAIIGMPLFAVFLSKLFILLQAAGKSMYLAFGLLAILLVATGAFGMFLTKLLSQATDGSGGEKRRHEQYTPTMGMNLSVIALAAIIFILGVYFPDSLNNMLNTIVAQLIGAGA